MLIVASKLVTLTDSTEQERAPARDRVKSAISWLASACLPRSLSEDGRRKLCTQAEEDQLSDCVLGDSEKAHAI